MNFLHKVVHQESQAKAMNTDRLIIALRTTVQLMRMVGEICNVVVRS